MNPTVTVVGAGLAGAACAVALRAGGAEVRVVERGRAPGGRMASPLLHGRRVDLGAGYFTVRDPGFDAVTRAWRAAGLARPWTDTFTVLTPGADPATITGPMRWATPGGLRSLVRHLLADTPVEFGTELAELSELPAGPVVLAMPDPQAARLVSVPEEVDCSPTITVVCGFDGVQVGSGVQPGSGVAAGFGFRDAAFVHDHPDLEFLADDGARRGDGAPVLVAHTTSERAQQHLDDPAAAVAPVLAALRELLQLPAPSWTHPHRWSLAKPTGRHDDSFAVLEVAGRPVGLAGDQWCPAGSPRVESAWRSGTDLGHALLARL